MAEARPSISAPQVHLIELLIEASLYAKRQFLN
jgi:hypothetical protein